MKKTFIMFIVISTFFVVYAQTWSWQNPLPQGDHLFDVQFVSSSVGWAVGDAGRVMKTTDGGSTWSIESTTVLRELYSLSFTDANNGTAVGYEGKIVRTTDGGSNWVEQTSGVATTLHDVSFSDANNGTAVGNSGVIIRTTDGGTNWVSQTSGTTSHFYTVLSIDANNVMAFTSNGKFYKTTNAGTNWSLISTITTWVYGAAFTDVNNGIAVGNNGAIKVTTDGGATWNFQISFTSNTLRSVSFTDANTGTVVGDNGTIVRTTNGGTDWSSQTSGTTRGLDGVFFSNANNGTAVGSMGIILITTNGGTNWTEKSSGIGGNIALRNVSFTDANTGTTVGFSADFFTPATILRTTNGGATWNEQTSPAMGVLYGVSFTDANTGTAVGWAGSIVRTTNGGTNWTSQTSPTAQDLNSVCFTDANNGTACGSGGVIIRTTNGGTDWSTQASNTTNALKSIIFTDVNNGTAVGDVGTIIHTTDGGTNWTVQSVNVFDYLNDVYFTDANNGTAVGGVSGVSSQIIRTTNGGTSWAQQNSGLITNLWGVCFSSTNIGTVVSNQGEIIRTTDGGTTWTLQSDITENWLFDVTCTDANNVTAVGHNLTILCTSEEVLPVDLTFTPPYLQNFDGIISPALPDGWFVENTNGDGAWMNSGIGTPRSVPNAMTYDFHGASAADDWFFSPGLNLTAGVTYEVTFYYSAGQNFFPEKLEVKWGPTQNSAGMTSSAIFDNNNINNTAYVKGTGEFTPGSSGSYYIGWHCYSAAFQDYVFVDDISIRVKPTATNNQVVPAGNTNPITFTGTGSVVQFITNNGGELQLTCDEILSSPGGALPDGLTNLAPQYWSIIVTSGTVNGTYSITFDVTDVVGVLNLATLHLLKRDDASGNWTDYGVASSIDGNLLTWTGFTGFSEFGLGGDNSNPLPVELTSFSALVAGTNINLNWQTATEVNNYGFEIEKTSPRPSPQGEGGEAGRGWEKIGFIAGHGNSNSVKEYSFVDKTITGSKYSYRLKQIDNDGKYEYSKEIEIDLGIPSEFSLSQNYPNPFNPVTTISWQLPVSSHVTLKVYDVLGKEVATLINNEFEAGSHSVNFDASNFSSGIYFYELRAGNFIQSKKMLLMK
ncbi:MAG: YCF48-related protein [Ignavibacteriaceae bacterium]|nr:YCF48-related protein [Ignavibacteriaceae bacterium]